MPRVDVTSALRWAEETVGPVTGVRELSGGITSTMLALTPSTGDEVVLRLMTNEPWRTHGAGLTTRESEIQRMLADTPVPAPSTLALDADGEHCGHPAHLMTLLPGRVDLAPSLAGLVEVLATVHEVTPTIEVREYQSWAWGPKLATPTWAKDPGLWSEALALLEADPPPYQPCFLHRDFQPGNVLWEGGRVTGVVDWVETSIGPAWLDIAHCATNLALRHGNDVAERFADAYAARTGRAPQPFFDVMDLLGFLPTPSEHLTDAVPGADARLEERLRSVLPRC